mmetsp:Transcript_21481/g.50696  ORF Transcript_21481/g.50696 Transcript_21481/m.50696 type:complete len:261 (+) Transcript_21481:453-1235(+)
MEGIVVQNSGLHVLGNECARVISRDAHGHLGEIIGTVAEEAAQTLSIRLVPKASNLIRNDRRTGNFDHGADFISNIDLSYRANILRLAFDDQGLALKLLEISHQWYHDAWMWMATTLKMVGRSVHNGADLHLSEIFADDAQTATTQTEHGILLVKSLNVLLQLMHRVISEPGSDLVVDLVFVRHKLMQRRVEQPNGDLLGVHCFEDLVEVAPLEVLDLVKILLAVAKDPVLDDGKTFGAEEHVLSSAESNTLGAMLSGLG